METWLIVLYMAASFLAVKSLLDLMARHREQFEARLWAEEQERQIREARAARKLQKKQRRNKEKIVA